MPLLDLVEQEALRKAVIEPVLSSALRKFFAANEKEYTEKSRTSLNAIPEDLHQRAKLEALARQYAAWAKAYGTAWAELEKFALG